MHSDKFHKLARPIIKTPVKSDLTNLPALVSYGEEVYRPAGYHIPATGDLYVSSRGHVARMLGPNHGRNIGLPTPRLILRLFNGVSDLS